MSRRNVRKQKAGCLHRAECKQAHSAPRLEIAIGPNQPVATYNPAQLPKKEKFHMFP